MEGTYQAAVFQSATDFGYPGGATLAFTLHQNYPGHELGRFRLSITTDNRGSYADRLATGGDVTANWVVLTPQSYTSANGATLTLLPDNSILSSGFHPDTDVYTVTSVTSLTGITGIRLEVLPDASLPNNGPGRYFNGNFALTDFQATVTPVPAQSLAVSAPTTTAVLPIAAGQAATLTEVASGGTPPFSYNGYQGNSGDTSNLVSTNGSTFTTPILTNTAPYWVRVSDSGGQTTDSSVLSITVRSDRFPGPCAGRNLRFRRSTGRWPGQLRGQYFLFQRIECARGKRGSGYQRRYNQFNDHRFRRNVYILDSQMSGPSITLEPTLAADAPLAEGITMLDVAVARAHILGQSRLTSPFSLLAADVNGSKTVSGADLRLISLFILNLTNFPAENGKLWRFVPADYVFPNPASPWSAPGFLSYTGLQTNLLGQNFIAVKLGDVNGSWPAAPSPNVVITGSNTKSGTPLRRSEISLANSGKSIQLSTTDSLANPGDTVQVAVQISQAEQLTTAQFTMRWNPSVLEFMGTEGYTLRGLVGTTLAQRA